MSTAKYSFLFSWAIVILYNRIIDLQDGKTALDMAVEKRNNGIVEVLKTHQCQVSYILHHLVVNYKALTDQIRSDSAL